jgi:TRAP-type mannitol/chloroaromatic compound transport system substrate-binding protein
MVIGVVVGIVIGATVVAPKLSRDRNIQKPAMAGSGEKIGGAALAKSASPETVAEHPNLTLDRALSVPQVRWRMAGGTASSLAGGGELAKAVETGVRRLSGGAFEIRLYEPGALAPAGEMLAATASGAIDAAFMAPDSWAALRPALQLFAGYPFGPGRQEFIAWARSAGDGLLASILGRLGVQGLFCGAGDGAAAGWFRKPVSRPQDIQGLEMRAPGLAGAVLKSLGARIKRLQRGDIFMALEQGGLDAVQFSTPEVDARLGFGAMAPNYYFPGWQRPAAFYILIVNKAKWKALAPRGKAAIKEVCAGNLSRIPADAQERRLSALKEIAAKGVEVRRLPPAVLGALASAWKKVAARQAAADPDFKRVWRSLQAFRKNYALLRELNGINN